MNWLAPPHALPKTPLLNVLAPELQDPSSGQIPHPKATAVAAWNSPASLRRARALAKRFNLPLLALGDGLLASPRLSYRSMPLLSLTGVFLEDRDTRRSGWAKELLRTTGWETPALMSRATDGIEMLVRSRIGGTIGVPVARTERRRVLIDASLAKTIGDTKAVIKMALAGVAPAEILLLLPDDQASSDLRQQAEAGGCAVISGNIDSWSLLETVDTIYTLGGAAGFLGLLAGHKVHCAANCLYSGWGLTTDLGSVAREPRTRTLQEVFAAYCIETTRYADPFHETPASFEDVAAILSDWRAALDRNAGIACCYGIDFWKRDRTRDFFLAPSAPPVIARQAQQALAIAHAAKKSIAYWPQRRTMARFEADARDRGVVVTRIEDGFIRSVGLGTNLVLPASIVADSHGIYYDPTRPSDLEIILAETSFDPALLARATRLGELLVDRRITKYNLTENAVSLDVPEGQRRILVPGQFEDDKSVLLGGAGITTNEELLRRVRAGNPDAFIVYKPHPDVESGHRKGIIASDVMTKLADAVVRRTAILSLIDWAHEVHTLTSQTGFEALLRGRRVVTYGQPYYAGWGLTTDHNPVTRRQRKLSLAELIAGTLILYPRYVDPVTRLPCGPEIVIDRIADPKTRDRSRLSKIRTLQGVVFAQAKDWAGHLRLGKWT